MIAGVLIALLLTAVQVCVVPGYDMADVASWLIGGVGMLSLLVLPFLGRFRAGSGLLGIPILYMIAVSTTRWVPGFTGYQIAWYVAGWGLICLAARGNIRVIMWALLAGILIQAAIQWFSLIPWAQHYPHPKDDIWGTFRQRIRYSTWIYAGVIAAWYLWHEMRKNPLRWVVLAVGVLGLVEISRAGSQTIQACAAVTVIVFLITEVHWRIGMLVGSVGLLIFLAMADQEWIYKNLFFRGRLPMWADTLKADFSPWWKAIIGHGAGAWTLDSGVIGWEMLRHPHNELVHIAYEYGILAVWWTVGLCGLAVLCASGWMLRIGILFVLASMLTNSASTYPEQFLLSCVFLGVGLGGLIRAADCQPIANAGDSAGNIGELCVA